jgi:O-antigen/teichoic acid export membrane protein
MAVPVDPAAGTRSIREELPARISSETEHPTNLRRRAVRGGTIFLVSRLATQLFVWCVTLIVARLLSPFDYGLMTTGLIFVGLADLLSEAGIGKALVQKERLEASDLDQGFTLSAFLALVLYCLLWVLADPASVFLGTPEFTAFLRLLAVVVLLVPFRSVPLALLERELSLGKQSAIHVAGAVIQSCLVLAMAVADCGYWSLAVGAVAARIWEAAALGYAAGWRPRLVRPGRAVGGLLAFGIHVSLGTLLWFIYSNCDYALIGKLAGPIALGYYAFAFQLVSLPVQKLTANVNQIVYPVFCRLQHDRERIKDWYLRLTVLLGFFAIPALTGMALVANDAFTVLLGEKWQSAILPFRLLSAVGLLMVFSASLPPLFNALGRPDINLKYTATCTAVMPLGFVLFGIPYGLVGICVVWLVFYPVLVSGLVFLTRRITGLRLSELLRAQVPVAIAVLTMAGLVLTAQGATSSWNLIAARLGLTIALGVLAYGSFVWMFARHTVLADLGTLLRELRR